MKSCSEENCERPPKSRGMCLRHYARYYKTAGFQKLDKTRPISDRFWEKVAVGAPDECWLWTGSIAGGYGAITTKSRKSGSNSRSERAHRVSYRLAYGDFDGSLLVCHTCDNPPCVNPKHLFLGTSMDNVNDMWNKGRAHPGGVENFWNSRRARLDILSLSEG